MNSAHVLVELVIVLGAAAAITLLFHALRLPVVLGYITAGLVIGPHVPIPLVANPQLVAVLSELGVIFLMFTIGLELRLSTLARVGVGAGLTAVFEVALLLTISALAATALGASGAASLFTGACFAISSTMLVAKAFEEQKLKGGFTELVFAILVFEDLCAIALLAVLTALASGSGLGPREIGITIAKLAGFLALLLVGGLIVVPRFVRLVARQGRAETLLVVALGLCFGLAILTEHAGYPVALGAFVAGLLVAESGVEHDVMALVRPFRDVFAMMFFVSVGMTVDPAEVSSNVPEIMLFSGLVLLIKPIGVAVGLFAAGRGVQPSLRAGISLAQTGELSFVVASIGIGAGVVKHELLAVAVGVTCVTTLVSSVIASRSEPVARWLASRLPSRLATFLSFYEAWLGRLRGRERATWNQVRRPAFVLAADVVVMIVILIGGAITGPRLANMVGMTGGPATIAITALCLVCMTPFAIGILRRIGQIARALAHTIIPPLAKTSEPPPLDSGRVPRRALILTFELAISTAIAVPAVAIVQPFIGTTGLVAVAALLVLLAIVYRSIVDFDRHLRAGSELVLELLHQPATIAAKNHGLDRVESVLPGLGALSSFTLIPGSAAIGRTLAELDLRACTGATVLAIARGDGGFTSPTPTERLHAGDVLALAGSDDALSAARTVLEA